MKMQHIARALTAVALGLVASATALAQTFPAHHLKLVVPFSAGGAADILGRAIGERMSKALGQPIIVENKPGAGGAIAAEYVARSAPDGYTLFLAGTTNLVLYPLLYSKRTYDAQKDFAGIGMVAYAPLVLVVPASSPARSVADFVRLAKSTSVAYGSSGNGTSMNVAGELFKARAHVDMLHVAYKGSPPALIALMAEEIGAVFDLVATANPMVEAGKLRALAVTTAKRSSAMPKVPTMKEAGIADFDFAARYALVAPSATPAVVVEKLNAALNGALRDPSLAPQLEALSLDPMPGAPQAVTSYAKDEIARLGPIVRASGIKVD